jgi:hypothetical protein
MGLRVGLAGNQTKEAEQILRSLALPVDIIDTSESWGVEKPSPAFFARLVEEAKCPADSVLYGGDRLDRTNRQRRGTTPLPRLCPVCFQRGDTTGGVHLDAHDGGDFPQTALNERGAGVAAHRPIGTLSVATFWPGGRE